MPVLCISFFELTARLVSVLHLTVYMGSRPTRSEILLFIGDLMVIAIFWSRVDSISELKKVCRTCTCIYCKVIDAYVLNANLFNREYRFSVLVRDLWYM